MYTLRQKTLMYHVCHLIESHRHSRTETSSISSLWEQLPDSVIVCWISNFGGNYSKIREWDHQHISVHELLYHLLCIMCMNETPAALIRRDVLWIYENTQKQSVLVSSLIKIWSLASQFVVSSGWSRLRACTVITIVSYSLWSPLKKQKTWFNSRG